MRPGATVIDVGINRITDAAAVAASTPRAIRGGGSSPRRAACVLGDVHPAVEAVAGALTPVPGGVGPLTMAMLLHNTVVARRRSGRRGAS